MKHVLHAKAPLRLLRRVPALAGRRWFCMCTGAALCLSLALPLATSGADNSPPPGFVALFNGRDLAGWQVPEGDGGHWKVVNGVIDYDAESQAKALSQMDGELLEARLVTTRAYTVPLYGLPWFGRQVRGTIGGRPVAGAVNSYVPPDLASGGGR